jgi:hypothetical protein
LASWPGALFGKLLIHAPCHGLQELARVVKVAAPEQAFAFTRQTVSHVGRGLVIYDDDGRKSRRW